MATKTRPLLIVTFIVALGTGVAAGLFLSRLPSISVAQPPAERVGDHSSLADDLQLDANQRKEMRLIWEDARDRGKRFFDQVQALQKGRDEALVALLNDDQKARYEKVARDFADRFAALASTREATFAEAVAQTKNILNPVQQKRYEDILKNRPPPPKDWLPPPVIKKPDSSQ